MADYHEMWEALGMDVKTHDLLCEALPGAFGDVYLSQENRPEGMDYFNMVVAEIHGIRPAELVEHKKNGGKVVGTFCIHVPDEIPVAAGAIATGLCSGSQFWVPGGEKKLPAATCPLIIVKTLNKFYNKKMAYDEKYKLRTLSYRNEGHTLSQTSAIFQISITTILKALEKFKKLPHRDFEKFLINHISFSSANAKNVQ